MIRKYIDKKWVAKNQMGFSDYRTALFLIFIHTIQYTFKHKHDGKITHIPPASPQNCKETTEYVLIKQ